MPALALMYHDVAPAGEAAATGFHGPGADRYKLTPEAFARHLDVVAASELRPELVTAPGDQSGRLFLTFDDGGRSASSTIGPMLEERSWRGHFFVTTGRIGTPGFVSASDVVDLHSAGHVIGSHSHTHPVLTRLSDTEIAAEWRRSKTILEDAVGSPVTTLSIPTGYYSPRVGRVAVELGYRYVFTSQPSIRPRPLGEGTAYGRFAVTAATPAAQIEALCRLSGTAILRRAVAWEARRLAKAALGPGYGALRRAILERAPARRSSS